MALIGNITIGMETDLSGLDKGLATAQSKMADFGDSAGKGGVDPARSFADVGQISTLIGGQIRNSLTTGLLPLTQIAGTLELQFDKVGGTLTTLARRIDSAMKFPAFDAFLGKVQAKLPGAWAPYQINAKHAIDAVKTYFPSMTAAANQAMKAINSAPLSHPLFAVRALVAGFQTIDGASRIADKGIRFLGRGMTTSMVGGYRALHRFTTYLGSMGDVARKSLARLTGITLATFSKPIAGAAKLAGRITGVGGAAKGATNSLRSMASQILVALGAFGLAYKAVEFFRGGIKGAVNLAETVNATKLSFGDASGEVVKFADELSSKFGIVKNDSLQLANSFAAYGRTAKLSSAETAQFAISSAQLAADLSSLKNISLERAGELISSGFAGEGQGLREYGVFVDEARIKEVAYAAGLQKVGTELTNETKIKARYLAMTQDLTLANGDLERTQGDAANQLRKASGGIMNLATSIGTSLLPALKVGVGVFNEFLGATTLAFESSKPLIDSWVEKIKSGFSTIGVVLRNFGTVWEIVKLKSTETFINIIRWAETIPANFSNIAKWLGENWLKLITDVFNAAATIIENFALNISDMWTTLTKFAKDPTKGFQWKFTPLLQDFKATVDQLPALIRPGLYSAQKEIDGLMGKIADAERARDAVVAPLSAPREAMKFGASAAGGGSKSKGQFAELAELGSKEAYSAIIRHQAGGDDPAKKTMELAKQQVVALKEIAKNTAKPGLVKERALIEIVI